MNDAFEDGFALYRAEPDLLLIEVWRRAGASTSPEADPIRFVEGYSAARRQRDARDQEVKS